MARGIFREGAGPWRGRHISYDGFRMDYPGISKVAIGPEMRHAMSDIAENAMSYAQLIAPSDTHGYQSSFSTDVLIVPDIPYRVRGDPMKRWSGRVVNDDRSAIYVEVGSGSARDHRVMRRTLEWIEMVADD